MKAIIIKANDKVIGVAQISEVSTKEYLELQREAEKVIKEKDAKVNELSKMLTEAKRDIVSLTETCKSLQHQINVITGEEEE